MTTDLDDVEVALLYRDALPGTFLLNPKGGVCAVVNMAVREFYLEGKRLVLKSACGITGVAEQVKQELEGTPITCQECLNNWESVEHNISAQFEGQDAS